jgi:galactonate dehydratase
MKIIDMKVHTVFCYRTNWIFVELFTDEGIVGIGEGTLEHKEYAISGALEDLREYLIGKDPRRIEEHFSIIVRDGYWRGGAVLTSALSAIEIAMWDITAKSFGQPIYALLGGKIRDSIPIYVNGWYTGARKPEEFAEKARKTVNLGIKALKWDPFGKNYLTLSNQELDLAIQCVSEVRNAVGKDINILIEGHGRFNVSTAIKIAKELEPFKPFFFEEPIPPGNVAALYEVRKKSRIPIAAGERLFTRYDFWVLFQKKSVDFIQPDVSHAGGILELKKIAAMAEANYISFMPHNPSGPIATAASLQLAACIPNFEMLEMQIADVAWRETITDEKLVFSDGNILISDKPGLGLKLNEQAIMEHPYQPTGMRHYNGTLTDIRPPDSLYIFLPNNH